jgi:uncharacterized protein (TIGR00369 family)
VIEVPVEAIPLAGFQRLVGFQVTEWKLGGSVVILDIRDDHLNRGGSVHGGVLATLIDAAGGLSGNYADGKQVPQPSITLTLITNFIRAIHAGRIRAVGTRRGGGARIFFSNVDVFDERDALIATGHGTYRVSKSATS